MPEYSIDFASEMSRSSAVLAESGMDSEHARRASLYMALVACEIAMKAALEGAGKPIDEIRSNGHSLAHLLSDLDKCTVLSELVPGSFVRVSASELRSVVVDPGYSNATVGFLMEAERHGASRFPNEIRYGDSVQHYPADIVSRLSGKVVDWVRQHLSDIRTEG